MSNIRAHVYILDNTGRYERRWILSLDDGLLVMIKLWIRTNSVKNGEPNMTAESFCDYLNTEILPQVAATATSDYDPFKGTPAIKATTEIMADGQEVASYLVNVRTARFWLHKLGCEYRDTKSGLYFDGHDRETC